MRLSKILFLTCCLFAALQARAQGPFSVIDLGIEFQAYPTGLIPGLRADFGLGEKNAIDLRLGYQVIDHQGFGVQDKESGTGFGFTLGYRRFLLQQAQKGLFLGIRNDIWFNKIKWVDDLGLLTENDGVTNLVVVQPTLQAGWLFALANQRITLGPTAAFGFEVNVVTMGEPTGQGPIILAGITAACRLK